MRSKLSQAILLAAALYAFGCGAGSDDDAGFVPFPVPTQTASPDLPVVPGPDASFGALNSSGTGLLLFNGTTPGSVTERPITGVTAGQSLVGMDLRPASGQPYALGYNPGNGAVQLYAISPETGAAALVGPEQIDVTDAGGVATRIGQDATTEFGFDFNPTVDRIRVTTSTGQNFRMNPNNGLVVDAVAGPGVNLDVATGATITAAAYTNSIAEAAITTLFTLDSANGTLNIQAPANNGTQTQAKPILLGGEALSFTSANGLTFWPGSKPKWPTKRLQWAWAMLR